ncbi:MAG: CvpA family protein [Erysipelotrichaceae bacterium]|nr:CvpA family protein [Erysipelotrichaceae bacterium]
MKYLIILGIVLMAQLLGVKRSLFADLTHLLSAVSGFVLTLILAPQLAARLTALLKPVLVKFLTLSDLLERILAALTGPLVFTAAFIVFFTVIGLFTHIINNLIKPKKKPKMVPKLILNLLSGLLIAYALLMPLGYYPNRKAAVDWVAGEAGYEGSISELIPESYQLPEVLFRPLISRLTSFRLIDFSATADEALDAYNEMSQLEIQKSDGRMQLIQRIADDTQKDELYGIIVEMLTDRFPLAYDRQIMAVDGRMSVKHRAAIGLDHILSVFRSRPGADNHATVLEMLKTADAESYELVASLCRPETFDVFNDSVGANAQLTAEIMRQIAAVTDRSDAAIEKEAEALTYLLSPAGSKLFSYNYSEMKTELAARYISDSVIMQNAYIKVTDGGKIMDPCNMGTLVYHDRAVAIIKTMVDQYGLSADSELYRSLVAYFGITDM